MNSHEILFRQWITEGWRYRCISEKDNVSAYKQRLHYEYETICAREGFVDYFLVVADLVRWAKDNGIFVGPGRGSAAASLVCYLLRITEIDPMPYPMLFERFLDPTRTDPPDIDIDFDDERRDEVFAYAARKYGEDRVANIGTFTYYRGRNSLDDVARVYHIPTYQVEAVKGKLIDRASGHPRFAKTLEDTYNTFPEIAALVNERSEFAYAPRLEGNVRNFGVHAAGMVISSVPLDEICATYERVDASGDRRRVIAFDKYDASYLGLLKIDILGLSTMGVIAKVCELVGLSLEELYRIPLDDEQTWAAFRQGDVLGVFQFEGRTARRVLKAVEPQSLMDLSHVNALTRPGANEKAYIDREPGLGEQYPAVAQHLSWTRGHIVYEEQILMILRDLGGFAPAELNRMRKVIHDKLGSTAFNEYYERFVKGCAVHGLSEDEAKAIWDSMVNASGYAFNIAHSISYSYLGYLTQYLKTHCPAEFFTGSLLKCGDEIRRAKFIRESTRHGISVEPPSLVESQENWTFSSSPETGPRIIAGFNSIPGVGPKTTDAIIEWRSEMNGVNLYWSDLMAVKGIGPKTISNITEFCMSPDPFNAHTERKLLESVRSALLNGEFSSVSPPTHTSIDIPPDKQRVVFVGFVRKKKYYDAVEQFKKRSTQELSDEEALRELTDSHLRKYVALYCEDEFGETVAVRISRWKYPQFARAVQGIKLNSDIVVAEGISNDFGGVSIQTRRLTVFDPHQD